MAQCNDTGIALGLGLGFSIVELADGQGFAQLLALIAQGALVEFELCGNLGPRFSINESCPHGFVLYLLGVLRLKEELSDFFICHDKAL